MGFTFTSNETQAASKKLSLKLSNGGTYFGEVKNGKPHGKGTATWGDYKTYSGEWKNGQRSGNGKFTEYLMSDAFEDGGYYNLGKEVYTGTWKNDKKTGQGVRTYYYEWRSEDPHREVSKGIFKNGTLIKGYHYTDNYSFSGEGVSYTYVNGDYTKEIKLDKEFYQLKKIADELNVLLPTKIKEKFNEDGILN
ncbi:hypothetical protein ACMX2M_03875 [Paenibacillus polymyxa]